MGTSGPGLSGQADTAEEVGLDRTHPKETSIQHHTPGPDLEPAGKKEERPASQQLEERHRGAAEAAGLHLDESSSNRPEKDGLAACRRWPMLCHEQWA